MGKTRTGNHIFLIRCWSLTRRGSDRDDGEMSATALSTGGLDKILTREATIRYMASFLICCFICSVCGGSSCDERSDKYRAQRACDRRGFYNAALLLSFKVLKLWCGGSSCDYDTLQIFLMAECLIVGGGVSCLSDGWKSLYVLTVIDPSHDVVTAVAHVVLFILFATHVMVSRGWIASLLKTHFLYVCPSRSWVSSF